jgi:hypothetical protein
MFLDILADSHVETGENNVGIDKVVLDTRYYMSYNQITILPG